MLLCKYFLNCKRSQLRNMCLPLMDQRVLWNSPCLVTQHSRSETLQPFPTAFGARHPECNLNMHPCSSWSSTCVHWKILNKQTKNKQKSTEPTAVTALQIATCSPFQCLSCMDTIESHLKLCGLEDKHTCQSTGKQDYGKSWKCDMKWHFP